MTRDDETQRPERDRWWSRFWRHLDLYTPDGATFLRRRGPDLHLGDWSPGIFWHHLDGPDPGIDVHDHPWHFWTLVLRGGYTDEAVDIRHAVGRAIDAEDTEHCVGARIGSGPRGDTRVWRRWSVHRMPLDLAHRIVAVEPRTLTLVVRWRKRRTWGFYCPEGWVRWTDYDYEGRRPSVVRSDQVAERRDLQRHGAPS